MTLTSHYTPSQMLDAYERCERDPVEAAWHLLPASSQNLDTLRHVACQIKRAVDHEAQRAVEGR